VDSHENLISEINTASSGQTLLSYHIDYIWFINLSIYHSRRIAIITI